MSKQATPPGHAAAWSVASMLTTAATQLNSVYANAARDGTELRSVGKVRDSIQRWAEALAKVARDDAALVRTAIESRDAVTEAIRALQPNRANVGVKGAIATLESAQKAIEQARMDVAQAPVPRPKPKAPARSQVANRVPAAMPIPGQIERAAPAPAQAIVLASPQPWVWDGLRWIAVTIAGAALATIVGLFVSWSLIRPTAAPTAGPSRSRALATR